MKFLLNTALFVLLLAGAAAGQKASAIEREIGALRQKIAATIERGDRQALAGFFAEGFVHTHATGKTDEKAQRLDGLLDGGPNIESVAPDEMRVRAFGKQTAVAGGRTTIAADGKQIVYRWTAVYVKEKGRWLVAATQATIVDGK